MLAHFQELKAQMNKIRDCEREKLTKLTLESSAAIKELKRQKEKVGSSICVSVISCILIATMTQETEGYGGFFNMSLSFLVSSLLQ